MRRYGPWRAGALPELRTAVTELVELIREWGEPDVPVITQALWLIALDGAPNSGIPKGMSVRVLRLMHQVVRNGSDPIEALKEMEGWE